MPDVRMNSLKSLAMNWAVVGDYSRPNPGIPLFGPFHPTLLLGQYAPPSVPKKSCWLVPPCGRTRFRILLRSLAPTVASPKYSILTCHGLSLRPTLYASTAGRSGLRRKNGPPAGLEPATFRLTGSDSENPSTFFGRPEPKESSKPPSIVRRLSAKPQPHRSGSSAAA